MLLRKTILYDDELGLRLIHWGGVSGSSAEWGDALLASRHVFCLNFGGGLMILQGINRIHLVGQMVGSFRVTKDLTANTMLTAKKPFNFLVVEVSSEWISVNFAKELLSASGNCVRWWEQGGNSGLTPARVLSQWENSLYTVIQSPPEDAVARNFWLYAKILEFLSLQIFRKDQALFCTRHKGLMKERVAGTLLRLREELDLPLDLAGLAKRASLTPTSLSRLVSNETGKTLSQHLRALRVERALELITQEECSVTEAAVEVGYSSLSHFTKAFVIETGRRPSDFL